MDPREDKFGFQGNKKICPRCGTSFDDFLKTLLFGCEYCYVHFEEELIQPEFLLRWQGIDRHYRIETENEQAIEETFKIEREIEVLTLRRRESLKKEDYDVAERLTRRILELQKLLMEKESEE